MKQNLCLFRKDRKDKASNAKSNRRLQGEILKLTSDGVSVVDQAVVKLAHALECNFDSNDDSSNDDSQE